MDKEEYADFLQSMEWKAVRNEYIKTHQVCGMCDRPASEVHHFKYETGELGYLNTKNLVSLCRSCHREVHLFDKLISINKGDNQAAQDIVSSFAEMIDVPYIKKLHQEEEYLKEEAAIGEYLYKLFFYAPVARDFIFVLISISPPVIRMEIEEYIVQRFKDSGSSMLERIKAVDKARIGGTDNGKT